MCIDYRKLNKATKKHHFPLTFIDEMLEQLVNHSVGFINPGSLVDRIPYKGSAQQTTLQTNVQLMGRPKCLNDRPEGRSNHRPEGLAEEERRPLLISACFSDRSTRFGL